MRDNYAGNDCCYCVLRKGIIEDKLDAKPVLYIIERWAI